MSFISTTLLRRGVVGDPSISQYLNWEWNYASQFRGVIPKKGNLLEFASREELHSLLKGMEAAQKDVLESREMALCLVIARLGREGSENLSPEGLQLLKGFFLWSWRIFFGILPAFTDSEELVAGIGVEFYPDKIIVRPNREWVGRIIGKRGRNLKKIDAFFSELGKRVIVIPQ